MTSQTGPNRKFAVGLARGFAGALVFSLPMVMTMEMWRLGFYMSRVRLVIFLALSVPMLVLLAYHAGFRQTHNWTQDVLDGLSGYAVGYLTSATMLALMGIIRPDAGIGDTIGKISLQAVPASIGAILARSQLGEGKSQTKENRPGTKYAGELFLMGIGALFFAANVAPTQEMVLISYKMTHWQTFVLAVFSIGLMHAFVYVVEFRGHAHRRPKTSFVSVFLRFTIVGYAIALLISVYALWIFGRTTGVSFDGILDVTVVLGFPAALGAAAARLVL